MRRITKTQRKSCESDIESHERIFAGLRDDVATLGILEGGARREAVGGMKSELASDEVIPKPSEKTIAMEKTVLVGGIKSEVGTRFRRSHPRAQRKNANSETSGQGQEKVVNAVSARECERCCHYCKIELFKE